LDTDWSSRARSSGARSSSSSVEPETVRGAWIEGRVARISAGVSGATWMISKMAGASLSRRWARAA
jgi:hypothetical protein